jgi:hypothetical protein
VRAPAAFLLRGSDGPPQGKVRHARAPCGRPFLPGINTLPQLPGALALISDASRALRHTWAPKLLAEVATGELGWQHSTYNLPDKLSKSKARALGTLCAGSSGLRGSDGPTAGQSPPRTGALRASFPPRNQHTAAVARGPGTHFGHQQSPAPRMGAKAVGRGGYRGHLQQQASVMPAGRGPGHLQMPPAARMGQQQAALLGATMGPAQAQVRPAARMGQNAVASGGQYGGPVRPSPSATSSSQPLRPQAAVGSMYQV